MAVVLVEGFDSYNGITSTATNIGIGSAWNVLSTTALALTTGRFGGQAVSINVFNPGGVTRSWNQGISSFTVGFALYVSSLPTVLSTDGDCFLTLKSGGTFMMGIQLTNTGALHVRRMSTSANASTSLGNTANGVIAGGSWYYIELSVAISDTTGTVNLRVNGQNLISLTNQDTRNGTPTTIDNIQIGGNNGGRGGTHIVDDLYIIDSTTPLGEQRVETLYPNADTAQEQWIMGQNFSLGASTTVSTSAFATKGDIFNCNANVTLKSVSSYFGAVAQGVKLGIARLTSANPGAVAEVLHESSVVNLALSTAADYKFTVPDIAFTGGNVYAIYFTRTDGDGTAALNVAFPGTAPPTTTDVAGTLTWNSSIRLADNNIGVSDSLFYANNTYVPMVLELSGFASNNFNMIDSTLITTTGFVASNTVGNYDLYDFGNLSTTPTTISAVVVNAAAQKDNAGTRAVAVTAKSGSNTSDGANTYLGVGFSVASRILETDPNNDGAWTGNAVNALQAGVKVTI